MAEDRQEYVNVLQQVSERLNADDLGVITSEEGFSDAELSNGRELTEYMQNKGLITEGDLEPLKLLLVKAKRDDLAGIVAQYQVFLESSGSSPSDDESADEDEYSDSTSASGSQFSASTTTYGSSTDGEEELIVHVNGSAHSLVGYDSLAIFVAENDFGTLYDADGQIIENDTPLSSLNGMEVSTKESVPVERGQEGDGVAEDAHATGSPKSSAEMTNLPTVLEEEESELVSDDEDDDDEHSSTDSDTTSSSDESSSSTSSDEIIIIENNNGADRAPTGDLLLDTLKSGQSSLLKKYYAVLGVIDNTKFTDEVVSLIWKDKELMHHISEILTPRDIHSENTQIYRRIYDWFSSGHQPAAMLSASLIPILLWAYIRKATTLKNATEEETCLLGIYNVFADSVGNRIVFNLPVLRIPSIYHSAVELNKSMVSLTAKVGGISEQELKRRDKLSQPQEFIELLPRATSIPLSTSSTFEMVISTLVRLFTDHLCSYSGCVHEMYFELCERLLYQPISKNFLTEKWVALGPVDDDEELATSYRYSGIISQSLTSELVKGLRFFIFSDEHKDRVLRIVREMKEFAARNSQTKTWLLTSSFMEVAGSDDHSIGFSIG